MSSETKQIGSGLDDIQFVDPNAGEKGSATAEDVREAMGNQIARLPKITVKHGGACIFKNEATGKTTEILRGVIVAFTKHNSFFGKKFDDRVQGERPKCYSNDGVTIAAGAPEPQSTAGCAGCRRNRDGEKGSATRKEAFELDRKTEVCNNYLTVVMIIQGGGEIPYAVQFPNTTFVPWANFNQEIYSAGRFKLHEVVSEITLVDRIQKGGSAHFSEPKFKMLGALPTDARPAYAAQNEIYTEYLVRKAESGAEGGEDNAGTAADAVARAKAAEEAVKTGQQQAAL